MATDPTTLPTIGDIQQAKKDMTDINTFVVSTDTEFTDNTGRERRTIEGINSEFDAMQSGEYTVRAETAADRAETAADASTLSGNVYADAAAGLAATVDGDYFSVISPSDDGYLDLYKNESGVAEYKKTYPSEAKVIGNSIRSISNEMRIDKIITLPDSENAALQLLGENTGLAIDINAKTEEGQVVVKNENGAITFQGSLTEYLGGVTTPSLVQGLDGNLAWSKHNLVNNTDNMTLWNSTGATLEGGFTDSKGGTQSVKITSSSNSQARAVGQIGYTPVGRSITASVIIKKGASAFTYISIRDSVANTEYTAYFDLNNSTTGSKTANVLSHDISDKSSDGYPLPSGYFRISMTLNSLDLYMVMDVGPCDSDGSMLSSSGAYIYVERPHAHYGKVTLEYIENPTTDIYSEIPIDYSTGFKNAVFKSKSNVVNTYSEDLTNSVWVKSGCSVSLSSESPINELCSRVTANQSNATVLQSITRPQDGNNFSAYIKPSEGHGIVEITTDGNTWVDITDQLDYTRYTRVNLRAYSDPVFGFRLSQTNDYIDVSLANLATNTLPSTPEDVYSTGSYNLDETSKLIGIPNNFTTYLAGFSDTAGVGGPFSLRSSENTDLLFIASSGSVDNDTARTRINVRANSSSLYADDVYNNDLGKFDISIKVSSDRNIISINNEVPFNITTVDEFNFNQLAIGNLGSDQGVSYFSKILVTNELIEDKELPTFKSGIDTNNTVRASSIVEFFEGVDGTSRNREPITTVLNDDGENAELLITWMQKNETGHHSEAPARLMARNYRFHLRDESLVALNESYVLYQQEGWVDGEGHCQSIGGFVVPEGDYKGRVVMIFSRLDGPDFTYDRNLYSMINDNGGKEGFWSEPKLVALASDYDTPYLISSTDGAFVRLPSSHPVAPNRVLTPIYGAGQRMLYTDNYGGADGTDWTLSPATVANGSEPTLTLLANGDLLATTRTETPDLRRYCISSDGGITFGTVSDLPSWIGAACAASAIQLDPSGVNGDVGRVAMFCPLNKPHDARVNSRMSFATDDTFEFTNSVEIFSDRYFGYSSAKPIFGSSYVALSVEGGRNAFNIDESVFLAIIKTPKI